MIGNRFAWTERPFGDDPGRILKTATPVIVLGISAGVAIGIVGSVNTVFLLAVILAAGFVVWGLADPGRGFYIAVILLPFVELVKRFLFIDQSVSQPQYLAVKAIPDAVVLVALLSYAHRDLIRRRLPLAPTAIDKMVLCFLIWNLAEVANPSSKPLIGLAGFDYTGVPIAMYFLARSVIRGREDVEKLARVVVVTAVIAALYGLKQEVLGLAPFETVWLNSGLTSLDLGYIESAGLLRAFSTFASHKEFGFYLAIAIGYAIVLMARHRLWTLALPILVGGLTVTWARDAWSCALGTIA